MAFFFKKPDISTLLAEKNEKGLIAALGYNGDPNIPGEAASALGDLGSVNAVGAILKTLKETEYIQVQFKCIKALGQIKDRKAVDTLISLINPNLKDLKVTSPISVEWDKLNLIVTSLGQIGDPKAVNPLIELFKLTDNKPFIEKVTEILADLNAPEWVDFLLSELNKCVEEPAFNTKASLKIVKACAKTGSGKGIEHIIKGLMKTGQETINKDETTILSQEERLFQKMVIDNIGNLDESILHEIEHMLNTEYHYVISEYYIPGDDAWGHRENQDEYVPRETCDGKTDWSKLREMAKKELGRRKKPV